MNKRYFLAGLIGFVLIVVVGTGYAHAFKFPFSKSKDEKVTAKKENSKAKKTTPKKNKNVKKTQEEYEKLKRKVQELLREKEHIEKDKNNILAQIKILLKEKIIYREAKETAEKFTQDNATLRQERGAIASKYNDLSNEIARLRAKQEKLLIEKEDQIKQLQENIGQFKVQMSGSAHAKIVRGLKGKISSLKKKKSTLNRSVRKAEKEIIKIGVREEKLITQLEGSQDDLDELQDEFEQLRKGYKALLLENKDLKKDLGKLPKKFAKLAHENEKFKKQTANLHYNTGVFYVLHKEYKLAIKEFNKALEIKPSDVNAHYNLGFLYAEYLENRPKSIKHFKEYLRLTKGLDEYADKAKQYILVWETYGEKEAK